MAMKAKTEKKAAKGHNVGTGLDALTDDVQAVIDGAERWQGQKLDEEGARLVRDLLADEVNVRKKLESAKADEKRPHLEANTAIEAKFKPILAKLAIAAGILKAALTAHIRAEEARREAEAAEARRVAAEAEKAAAAADEGDDPFDAFEKREAAAAAGEAASEAAGRAEKVLVGGVESGARATGLRTSYEVEVTDAAALVAYYAKRREVIDLCAGLAKTEARAAKGQADIPGVAIKTVRKV